MRVLVTGASGLIGSNVALELARTHSVVGLCNISPGSMEYLKGSNVEFVKGDITRFDFSALGKFEAIFHQAAITDTTVTDRAAMFSTNVDAFLKLLEYAQRTGCRKVVYASSAATYGKGKVPMRETDTPAPANIYGESKVEMERVAKAFVAKHPEMSAVGLRYFNVYGPNEFHKAKAASMVYQLYKQIAADQSPRIFKWGDQFRDFIYVKDVALANVAASEYKGSGAFNVGTGIPTSFNQVIAIINKALGKNKPTDYFDNPYNFYQDETQADMTLSRKELKFECRFTPETGITDYVRILESRAAKV